MREVAPGVFEGGNPGTPAPMVPTITSRQGKRALVSAGLHDSALAAIESLPEPARTLALIDWNAPSWTRTDPTLGQMAEALGITSAQLDDLFALAATL